MQTFIIFIVMIGVLILIHEFGHYWVAKKAGVQVDEFAIGFGPKLYSWKREETLFSVRAFPLGGFVRMAGMDTSEEAEEHVAGKGFSDKSVAARMGIISAGPIMNFVLAMILFALLFGFIGVPVATLTIDRVEPGMPADRAGLRQGDTIVAVDGTRVEDWDDLVAKIQANADTEMAMTVKRDGQEFIVSVTPEPRDDVNRVGYIGIAPETDNVREKPLKAIVQGVYWTLFVIVETLRAFGSLFVGSAQGEVMGIVGIYYQVGEASKIGAAYVIYLAAILSANLGLINLLPIPALDGSRLAFLSIEAVRKKPVDPAKENFIHFVGFALLMGLAIVIAYKDIMRFFN